MLNPGNMLSLKDKGAHGTSLSLSQDQECPDSRNIMPSVKIGLSNYPNDTKNSEEDDVIENHYVETPLSL